VVQVREEDQAALLAADLEARQGVAAGPVVPHPLAVLAPGLAARQAALDQLAAALEQSGADLWAALGAPLAAALDQAGRQWAEHLRLVAAALRRAEQARRAAPLVGPCQAAVSDLADPESGWSHPVERAP